jgi:hypothetical protein
LICAAAAFCLGAEEIKTINLSEYIRSRYKAGQRDIVLPDGKVKCKVVTLGKEFKDLTEPENKALTKAVPMKISEAEEPRKSNQNNK